MPSRGLRIVLLADTHLGFDYPLKPRVQRRRRGPDFFDSYRHVVSYAETTRPDLVVHGGDFFFRSRVPRMIVDMAYDSISRLARTGIPILLVPGNHERSKLPTSLWLANDNIHIFDRARTFILVVRGTRVAVSGFPFVRDIGLRFRTLVAETGWQRETADVRLLCMHQAVEGARVGASDYTFRSGDDVVTMSELPGVFAAVLAGHIHRMQVLANGAPGHGQPVIYPGSTERTSFAERDERKGFVDLKLVPDGDKRWRVDAIDFIELPTRPMVDVEIGPEVSISDLTAHIRDRVSVLDRNSVVRIKASGPIDRSVRSRLTSAFLRSIVPCSMNVQLAAGLYEDRLAV